MDSQSELATGERQCLQTRLRRCNFQLCIGRWIQNWDGWTLSTLFTRPNQRLPLPCSRFFFLLTRGRARVSIVEDECPCLVPVAYITLESPGFGEPDFVECGRCPRGKGWRGEGRKCPVDPGLAPSSQVELTREDPSFFCPLWPNGRDEMRKRWWKLRDLCLTRTWALPEDAVDPITASPAPALPRVGGPSPRVPQSGREMRGW